MSSFSVNEPEKAFLNEHDYTAVSFWIISIAMIAATVFFYAEAATVSSHWKSSLHVGGLVTLVAAVHYMYMREYWVAVGKSPIVYRYIDWSITVPLQMIEFNLILKAAKHRSAQVASGNSWLAPFACLPSVTLVRPVQSIHGLASLWVCAAGLSSSSRFLLGNLLRRLAPAMCQKPLNSLSTTCVSS